jgi:hypothetical protein
MNEAVRVLFAAACTAIAAAAAYYGITWMLKVHGG